MGNNNSQRAPASTADVVRRPPSRPEAPPSARPVSELGPRGPSYHAPENQVLPKELPVMRLRPVSMELSKYHPEYQEIFMGENKENECEDDENVNNDEMKMNVGPERPPPPMLNGHIPGSNTAVQTASVSPMPNEAQTNVTLADRDKNMKNKTSVPYRPSLKRQASLTANLAGQEHAIIEEPEESIDNRIKLDPLMQSYPGATGPSLPVKNNFNLDYSYQLTYVQLAEHRRNKTIEELEKRTGKKLSDLSADLNDNAEPSVAFKRGAPSRVSSKSLGSSGSAVSSKKKKAPPPPTANASQNNNTKASRKQPSSEIYTIDNEPPIDYDMESPRRNVVLPRYAAIPPVSRVSPSQNSGPLAPPPPPPPITISAPRKPTNLKRNNSMSNGTPEIILKKTPSINSSDKTPDTAEGQVPWLLEIKNFSEARASRRQVSFDTPSSPEIQMDAFEKKVSIEEEQNTNVEPFEEKASSKLVYETSTDEVTTEFPDLSKSILGARSVNSTLERNNSLKSPTKPSSQLHRYHSTSTYDRQSTPVMKRQTSVPESSSKSADPVRRLSSLLQHDIKTAANAKCLKLVKQTTPVPPKPKDPHTVFREQLQKACLARDERAKTEGTIDEKLKRSASVDDEQKVSMEDNVEKVDTNHSRRTSNESSDSLPKPTRYHKNVQLTKASSNYKKSRQMAPFAEDKKSRKHTQDRQSSASLDWTPEDDLDSDDNLSDRETVSGRKGSSDGFKSTIIPGSVTDLKGKKYVKSKNKDKDGSLSEEPNKNKFGSVKKFKKNVHKSVKNAFGSISKASGKLLRKQKTEDLEVVEDVPNNWRLTAGSNRSSKNKQLPSQFTEHAHEYDSDEDGGSEVYEKTQNGIMPNGIDSSGHESSDEDEHEIHTAKNTRVRETSKVESNEVNMNGHYMAHSDEDSDRESIPKLKDKKKKSEGTSRKKERDSDLYTAEELQRHKERKLEEERRKQLEMELEFHKAREKETRERLQRLESAHLQQQINAQLYQQQQQNNVSMLSAPPLPPAGTFPHNYTLPDATQTPGYGSLFGQQLPPNSFSPHYGIFNPPNGSSLNGTAPFDLNDYMRMLGLQTPPTSQQMAFFLNSMTLTGQPFERKSNPTLLDVLAPDPMKSFPASTTNFPLMDTTMKSQHFQNWSSTPNLPTVSSVNNVVPMGDFVANYNNNGAKGKDSERDNANDKRLNRNPVYSSDDSDGGLSPQKTVARAQVGDFRPVPVSLESDMVVQQYANDVQISVRKERDNKSDMIQNSGPGSNASDRFARRQRSASPTNSTSTMGSTPSTPLSSPSLPAPGTPSTPRDAPASPVFVKRADKIGFKTVLDLTNESGSTHISMVDLKRNKTSQ